MSSIAKKLMRPQRERERGEYEIRRMILEEQKAKNISEAEALQSLQMKAALHNAIKKA